MAATRTVGPSSSGGALAAGFGALFFRYLAGAVALFALVNEARGLASPGFSVAYVLFRVSGAPWGADVCLALLSVLLVASAFGPVGRPWVARGLAAGLVGLSGLAAWNAVEFYELLARGRIGTAWPVPLSVVLAVYLLLHVVFCVRPRHLAARGGLREAPASRSRRAAAFALAMGALVATLVFHLHALGLTDYRRPADAIVVLGARVYSNGVPSEALRERVLTGVELYKQGLSARMIMSGGIGDSGQSEPRAMRDLAVRAGVPAEAVLEDELGTNTEATVENVEGLARQYGLRSVLAVSHYHHLPRIRLLFARHGIACFTVPADEGDDLLLKTPYYVLRETVALVWVYLKG